MSQDSDVRALVERYFRMESEVDGLPLAVSPIGAEEIEAAIGTLLSGWLTMGSRVAAFEQAWADSVGTRHAVCVNSGSSALLVMLTALGEEGFLKRGDEVIVPAVGWSTSLFTHQIEWRILSVVGKSQVAGLLDVISSMHRSSADSPGWPDFRAQRMGSAWNPTFSR